MAKKAKRTKRKEPEQPAKLVITIRWTLEARNLETMGELLEELRAVGDAAIVRVETEPS
jgi:hypothetical protein